MPYDHTTYMREYTRRNRDKINAQRKKNYYHNREHILQRERNRYNRNRPHKRQLANAAFHKRRNLWSTTHEENVKQWKEAEEVAVKILTGLGYTNIKYLGGHAIFDIIASKDGMEYVFDVTLKIRVYKPLQYELTKRWSLNHRTIFITLENKKYVIRDFNERGYYMLTMKDIKGATTF